jgi:hypothetical protein
MTISFENTQDDAIEAITYMNMNLPNTKSSIKIVSFFGYILLFLGSLMIFGTLRKFSVSSLIMSLYFMFAGLFFVKFRQFTFRRNVRNAVRSGAAATIVGPHQFTPKLDGLHHRSKFAISTLLWSGIEKIEEFDKYFAFHFSSAQAFFIPKRAFSSPEQGAEFMRLVEQYRQQSTGTPIPQATRGTWWTQGSSVTESENQEIKRN